MNAALDQLVRSRAGQRCEYCHAPQSLHRLKFPIDHVTAEQHGGDTDEANLALCCARCNRHKGPNLSGIDPETGRITRLFHPRRDAWASHFRWDGAHLVGVTPIGRVTVIVLKINHPIDVAVREELIAGGRSPEG